MLLHGACPGHPLAASTDEVLRTRGVAMRIGGSLFLIALVVLTFKP